MAEKDNIVGAKIEITKVKSGRRDDNIEARTYYSKVLDVEESEEGTIIKASMPIFEGHIVPLSIGTQYNIFFSIGSRIFESTCQVSGRSKDMNIFVMDLLLTGPLKRVQRRQYYRLPCDLNVSLQKLNNMQVISYENTHQWDESLFNDDENEEEGVLVDLSGGGLRLHSPFHYEKDTWIKTAFNIIYNEEALRLELLGRIVSSYSMENDRNVYETRVQFCSIPNDTKEKIVKYIFQEQRRMQQKVRG